MILDDDLRRLLRDVSCRILQFKCSDCATLCTWIRTSDGLVAPVGGCICNSRTARSRVEHAEHGWEDYPPQPH